MIKNKKTNGKLYKNLVIDLGIILIILSSAGCISTNPPTPQESTSPAEIGNSADLIKSENTGIFLETFIKGNHPNNVPCGSQYSIPDVYEATYYDGNHLKMLTECNEIASVNLYAKNNEVYEYNYNAGNPSYKGHTGQIYNSQIMPSNTFTKNDVTDEYNQFVKQINIISNEVKQKLQSNGFKSENRVYADFYNLSDNGKFVIKVLGTEGIKISGSMTTTTSGIGEMKDIEDTIPKEFDVNNLKNLNLEKKTSGLLYVEIWKDNKLIYKNYENNGNSNSFKYDSDPNVLRNYLPEEYVPADVQNRDLTRYPPGANQPKETNPYPSNNVSGVRKSYE